MTKLGKYINRMVEEVDLNKYFDCYTGNVIIPIYELNSDINDKVFELLENEVEYQGIYYKWILFVENGHYIINCIESNRIE